MSVDSSSAAAARTGGDTPLISWLRAVLWGAFLVPLLAFVCAAWWGYRNAEREAEAAAEHACRLVWQQALRTFRIAAEIAERADSISSDSDQAARAREREIHQRLADMTAGLPFVVNMNVWDAQGTPIARSDIYPVDPNASVLDRPYFQAQRDAAQPLGISAVLKGRQTGREISNATIRRRSADGSFRGIVAVSLAPGYFRDYYQSLASEVPRLATFALIRTDGEIIARWPEATDGRSRVPDDSPTLAQIRAGTAGGQVVLPATQGRETRLVAFQRLEGYPLYVTAGFSRT
ncbi:hypothetical protein, partial [Pelomonas sp. KK5]|uniref:hypothetical protein n=1 Tax=Pelomonas sp. KK5 TaxID=1855730 RepID=UPI0018EA2E89